MGTESGAVTQEKLRWTEQKTPDRLLWADLLRIGATLAVMVQHLTFNSFWTELPPASWGWQALNFYGGMTKWCVPVFVMLSGMLFLDPAREMPAKKLWGKHILRLVAAFFFWSALYTLYTNRNSLSFERIPALLQQLLLGHYHMWFLFLILGLYMVVPPLRKLAAALTRREYEYFLLLWLVFSSLLPALRLFPGLELLGTLTDKADMQLVVGFSGYFLLGRYFCAYPLAKGAKRGLYFAGLLGFLLTEILSAGMALQAIPAVKFVYKNLSPNLILMGAGVFVFCKEELPRLPVSERWGRRIARVSNACFGAFLAHDFFISFAHRLGLTTDTFHPALSVPVMLIWVAAGSLLTSWLLRKLPFARRFLT